MPGWFPKCMSGGISTEEFLDKYVDKYSEELLIIFLVESEEEFLMDAVMDSIRIYIWVLK